MRSSVLRIVLAGGIASAVARGGMNISATGQEPDVASPIHLEGTTQVGQVFNLPPNPGAPFTAVVEFETTQTLSDGSVVIHKSSSNVARDSKGRTRNELRVQADGPNGPEMQTVEVVLYNPATGIRTTLSPRTHTGSQLELKIVAVAAKGGSPTSAMADRKNTQIQEIGMDTMSGLAVRHFREKRIYPAGSAGNSGDIETTFDYWYSQDLKVNLLGKRSDPRAGTQTAALKNIRRGEPDASLFEIPSGYKVTGLAK